MKIGTQVLDLDKLADEVLAKSMKTDDDKDAPANDKVNPEDISANIPDNDNEKPEEVTSEEKEDREEPVKKSVEAAEKKDGDSLEKSEPEDEEPAKESGEDEEENEEGEEIEKSFKSNDTIQKSIEASEFLESMVELIVKSLTDTQASLQKSQNSSADAFEVFAKSLGANLKQGEAIQQKIDSAMGDIKKSISDEIATMKSEILSELEEFSRQPASMRKSMKSVNVQERNFQKSLGSSEVGETLFIDLRIDAG